MNQIEMQEKVDHLVPTLAKLDADELENAEKLRLEFISDYPVNRIINFSLDEYVIGKGKDDRSFCYRFQMVKTYRAIRSSFHVFFIRSFWLSR